MFIHTINIMDARLTGTDTEPALQECLIKNACGRGGVTMAEVCHGMGELYTSMAANQDRIGGWRFMEEMVCKKIPVIWDAYSLIEGTHTSTA